MAAEIHKYGDPENNGEPRIVELGEKGINWEAGYGDGSGNTTFVNVTEGRVEIFEGRLSEAREQEHPVGLHIKRERIITILKAGEPYVGQITRADGDFFMIQVRNLGHSAVDPDVRPAWN